VLAAGAGAVALLVQYAPISAKVLEGLDRCQVVARYGAGLDVIDLCAARKRGVEVVNVPTTPSRRCRTTPSPSCCAFVAAS
jgi:D-3-phosphoglycerate dehydrogenase